MTTPFGAGGRKPESREARILGSITAESYDYRDQSKFMVKMANDVGYMSAYMRKMQRGIDAANENFIQQIQRLINDILVLFAGNGDTGFEFGDLKYIFQAIGALFGFGEQDAPLNLFTAAWHFFSTYIFPLGSFEDAINFLVDGFIAVMLDWFGEIPIIGQAIQQLAVFISNLRDFILNIDDMISDLINAIISAIRKIPVVGGTVADVLQSITDLLGLTEKAQQTGTDAQDQIAIMQAGEVAPGGTFYVEPFNGDAGDTFSDFGMTTFGRGPGSGSVTCDGKGNMFWTDSGNAQRQIFGLLPGPLNTHKQAVRVVVEKEAETPAAFTSPSYNYVIACSNLAGTEFYFLKWRYDAAMVGFYTGGSETILSIIGTTTKNGDSFELRVGETTARNLRGYRNGNLLVGATNLSAAIPFDSDHLYSGTILMADTRGSGQNTPASISILTAKDF